MGGRVPYLPGALGRDSGRTRDGSTVDCGSVGVGVPSVTP